MDYLVLAPSNDVLTMSSREIADLTGKSHGHVLRDIDDMLNKIFDDETSKGGFIHKWIDPSNRREFREYRLPQDLTITLVSGYNAALRHRIVTRWIELEAAKPKSHDLSDPRALRALLLDYSERVIQLDAKIAADAPKVEFAEQVRALDGVCSVEQIAKTLGYGRNKFFKALKADGVLMENRLPYQKYIDRCYFTVVENAPYTDKDGNTHPTFTTRVTGAGQVFLQRKYGRRKDDVV